jgi:hypothetical protein
MWPENFESFHDVCEHHTVSERRQACDLQLTAARIDPPANLALRRKRCDRRRNLSGTHHPPQVARWVPEDSTGRVQQYLITDLKLDSLGWREGHLAVAQNVCKSFRRPEKQQEG